jgi:hypothetical protein
MTVKNVPTSFTSVHKKQDDPEARENSEMIMLTMCMDYVKANPDFFQCSKE